MKKLDDLLARRPVGWVLFIIFLLLWAVLAKAYTTDSWQEDSRLATVQALVEQGTFIIDHTEFNRTGDKIFINGHFYSDKTPLFSVAAAGVYTILHRMLGLRLDTTICLPAQDSAACRAWGPDGLRLTAFYWLNLILVGVPSALLIALVWDALTRRPAGGLVATGLAVSLGLASPIGPYSIVLTSHLASALCLFAGFILLARSPGRWRFFWAGLWLGLAANMDLLLTLFVATFGVWVVFARRAYLVSFGLGVLIPYAMSAITNYWVAGTLIPLYLDPGAYDFYGTVLHKAAGGTEGFYSLQFGLRYAYDLLIGRRGVFAYTPLLIYAVTGMWKLARHRQHAMSGLALAALAGCLAFTAYLIWRTDNFAGVAWGVRWFVPLTPLLWYLTAVMFDKPHKPMWWLAFVAAWIISAATVAPGLYNPWNDISPIFFLEWTALSYS